ncbi:MAG: DNA-protecting protein DprA [Phycisphaerales bacterium]|nr:DNA-protecting protein DprA [Phycisphaerales bacterium]
MPREAGALSAETLIGAVALDRGHRAWRAAAVRAGSLADLVEASQRTGALEDLLESSKDGGASSAAQLRGAIARADPEAERDLMESLGVGIVERGDPDYPPMLASSVDPPAALWVRGTLALSDAWSVAVVGARRASPYGTEQSGRFAASIAAVDVAVISGAARGIDAEAHRGALRAEGRTIAIVGGGLAEPYPPEHIDLLDEIVASGGAVISECPMRAVATPDRFPSRNRIIAAMALGTLVIEAASRSGAIITANVAAELGRLCMALPGPVSSGRSAGCHHLIASMQASLVESPDEVLRLLVEHASTVHGAQALASAGLEAPRQFQPRP